jgi:PAS domain S-box-containing protein
VTDQPLHEESAEELYEDAPCGYLTTRADGLIVRANRTFLDWLGYERDALVGRVRFQELLTVPGRMFYETQYAPLLRLQGSVKEVAFDLRCAGGGTLPATVNSVERADGSGHPLIRTTLFDATDRRTYERELLLARRREEQLAAVVRASGDAIFIATPAGVVQTWNAGAERLFGWTAAEAIGRSVLELIVVPERREQFARIRSELGEGRELRYETVCVARDGRRIDVLVSVAPHIEPPGELVGISAIIRDVTERKRVAERLRQAEQLQAVGTLAGGVAHEVNNQMTAVLGFGSFVLEALGPDHAQTEDVQRMVDAAERSARITQQLLAFSRRQPLAPQILDLHDVAARLAPVLIRTLGADKALTILPRRARRSVRADPTQIEQVLINLAANARDAMDTNGRLTLGTEDVTLMEDDRRIPSAGTVVPGPYVRLTVTDTGVGMDEATQARIFEPFFTTKPVGQGTGLGLSTVYGIVKQHEGYIAVTSAPGRGTVMRVYLPAVPGDLPEPAAGTPFDGGASAAAPRPAEVLLVEDEAVVRDLLSRALAGAGIVVHAVANGRLALDWMQERSPLPDLVVTDLIMPEMNGHQLGLALEERWPGLPVLYTSAYSGDEMQARGMLAGGAPFLQKPFGPAELLDRVTELLRVGRD